MRRYQNLNTEEQTQAVNKALESLLKAIVEGALRFNGKANKDDLQKRIDKALAEADRLQTPWFAAEIILEDGTVKEKLMSIAQADAESAYYPDKAESIIRL